MMERFFVLFAIAFWYIAVRTFIYRVVRSGGRADMARFDWWWSWGVAFPASILSMVFVALFITAIMWAIRG